MIIEPKRKSVFGSRGGDGEPRTEPSLELFVTNVSFASMRYNVALNIDNHAEFCFSLKAGTFDPKTVEALADNWDFIVLEIEDNGEAVCSGLKDDDIFCVHFQEDESNSKPENIRLI